MDNVRLTRLLILSSMELPTTLRPLGIPKEFLRGRFVMDDATYPLIRKSFLLSLGLVLVGCSSLRSPATTAASHLKIITQDADPNKRYAAYAKLATPSVYDNDRQKGEAVKTLIDELTKAREPLATRAQICRTLGELRDTSAREVIISATGDPNPVIRVEACRALGKIGKSEDATILARIMNLDQEPDCRVAAVDALGLLKSQDPRIHSVLVMGLEHEEPSIRYASYQALKATTGKDLGIEAKAWSQYLEPKADPETKPAGLKNESHGQRAR